jgi:hypothetical protein
MVVVAWLPASYGVALANGERESVRVRTASVEVVDPHSTKMRDLADVVSVHRKLPRPQTGNAVPPASEKDVKKDEAALRMQAALREERPVPPPVAAPLPTGETHTLMEQTRPPKKPKAR